MSATPFEQTRFEDLPELPRKAHGLQLCEVHEVQMDSAPFGRLRVHCKEYGSGPPLLLVHGLMTSSYSWRYVVEPLGRNRRLVIPDLPGAGRSDKPRVRYTTPAVAAWIGEFVEARGIRGCQAIGNSMGGYLCMWAALDDPGLFGRLVNVHSPGLPELRFWALRLLMALPGLRSALATRVRRDPLRWAHRQVRYRDESLKSLEEAREYGEPLARPEGARALVSWLVDGLDPRDMVRFQKKLEARNRAGEPFPVPLLLVFADYDPLVPARLGLRYAKRIPGARLEILKESSHFAHVDTPGPLLDRLRPFLDGGGEESSPAT